MRSFFTTYSQPLKMARFFHLSVCISIIHQSGCLQPGCSPIHPFSFTDFTATDQLFRDLLFSRPTAAAAASSNRKYQCPSYRKRIAQSPCFSFPNSFVSISERRKNLRSFRISGPNIWVKTFLVRFSREF